MAYLAMDTRRGSIHQSDRLLKQVLEDKHRQRAKMLRSRRTRSAQPDDEEHIILNIGGTLFDTKKSTLRNVPCSRLGKLTDQDRHFVPSRNQYFFDRNPTLFPYVLDYYRYGQMHIPRDLCCKAIKNEMKYWELGDGCISECCRKYYFDVLDSYTTYELVKAQFNQLPTYTTPTESEIRLGHNTLLNRTRERVWVFFDNIESSLAAKIYAFMYYGLIVLSLLQMFLSSHPSLRVPVMASSDVTQTAAPTSMSNVTATTPLSQVTINTSSTSHSTSKSDFLMSSRPHDSLANFDRACMILFTIDFVCRLAVSPTKQIFLNQVKSWYFVFDALYLVPVWSEYIITSVDPDFFYSSKQAAVSLVALEACMTMRVFRLFRLSSHYRGLRVLLLAIKASMSEFILLFIFISFALTIYGTTIYCVEINRPDGFDSIFRGLWWALVTMTTVGYGDIVPQTTAGYLIASLCALTGIIIIGMVVPMIAGNFMIFYGFRYAGSDGELNKPDFVPSVNDCTSEPSHTTVLPSNLNEALLEEDEMTSESFDSFTLPLGFNRVVPIDSDT